MANLYGVAAPNPLPVGALTIGGTDVVCSTAVETNVIAITVNNPTVNGWYYPAFLGWLLISLGATPPGAINIGWRLGNGSDAAVQPVPTILLVASANILMPVSIQAAGLIVSNPSGTNTFNVSVFANTQPVTVRNNGSFCQCAWVRATDQ